MFKPLMSLPWLVQTAASLVLFAATMGATWASMRSDMEALKREKEASHADIQRRYDGEISRLREQIADLKSDLKADLSYIRQRVDR